MKYIRPGCERADGVGYMCESEKPVIYRARALYVNELPMARQDEVTRHTRRCAVRKPLEMRCWNDFSLGLPVLAVRASATFYFKRI